MPRSLLTSAFGGEAWQQFGFKVMLSLHKDGACIAGGWYKMLCLRLAAAKQVVRAILNTSAFDLVVACTACIHDGSVQVYVSR
jgi:hypothetical protein